MVTHSSTYPSLSLPDPNKEIWLWGFVGVGEGYVQTDRQPGTLGKTLEWIRNNKPTRLARTAVAAAATTDKNEGLKVQGKHSDGKRGRRNIGHFENGRFGKKRDRSAVKTKNKNSFMWTKRDSHKANGF